MKKNHNLFNCVTGTNIYVNSYCSVIVNANVSNDDDDDDDDKYAFNCKNVKNIKFELTTLPAPTYSIVG